MDDEFRVHGTDGVGQIDRLCRQVVADARRRHLRPPAPDQHLAGRQEAVGERDGGGQITDRHLAKDKIRRVHPGHNAEFLRIAPMSPDFAFELRRLVELKEVKDFRPVLLE